MADAHIFARLGALLRSRIGALPDCMLCADSRLKPTAFVGDAKTAHVLTGKTKLVSPGKEFALRALYTT